MSPPPNWDDDFDFEDQAPKKKPAQKKKVNKDSEFFDDDQNTNKLPSISSKNIIPKQPVQNKRTSARQNPYAQNMKLRGNIYDDDLNDDLYDEPKIKPNNKAYNDLSNKKKQVQEDMEYYQELDDQPKKQIKKDKKPIIIKKEQPPKIQPEEEQNYQQQVYQDAYGEDFQEIQQLPKEPPKKVQPVINTDPQKKKQVINLNNKNDNSLNNQKKAPPKPPSRSSLHQKNQPQSRNFTVQKSNKVNIVRSGSRQSLKSAESKRANQSRVNNSKLNTNLSFIPNKYTTEIDKAFPDDVNLNQLNQDKVNKMNEKLRAMIKKFNEELNELINKNMLYLKSKKQQKSPSIENKLRVLEEQSKNNQTMIQVMQKQFDKLSGRDGELRQQQYQLLMQRKIEESKQLIKQCQKTIVKLKTEIKSQGNKLTNKNQDKKLAAQLHHLKTTLIQSKKDQQKQTQKIEKLDEQMQDLNQKINEIDYKLSDLIDQAKQKGIQLESKQQLIKKYEMTKKKVEVSRNHRAKLQNLLRTKSDIVNHQKQQLKINIKNNEMQIKNLYDSISHVHNQSIKVVEKAKTNPKISSNILNDLDSILKSLQLIPLDNYSVRSEENRSQASHRPPLKNSDTSNMQKSQPQKRSESANNDKHNDKSLPSQASQDHSKPNLLKKKLKTNDMLEEKKNEGERIWRQQEKQKQKKEDNKLKQLEKGKQKQREKEPVVEEQKDKKKPFTLKKNRGESKPNQSQDHHKIQETKIHHEQQNKKHEQQKKQQISLAGPRMMKFRRKTIEQKDKEVSKQISRQQQKPIQKLILETKPIQQQPLKIQQDKPSFVPKRFNLRNRQEKKQQSYVPSIQTKQKEQPKKIQQTIQKKAQQYKPKFNFGDVEDNFKKPLNEPVQKKQSEKIVIPTIDEKKQDEQSKPKFNLRLRDRKKNTQQIGGGGYLPTFSQNKPEQKPAINLNLAKKQAVINQPASKQIVNNPNAPKDTNLNKIQNTVNTVKQEPKTFNLQANSNNNNPYAPKQQIKALDQPPVVNPYAQGGQGVRKKQGPIKKPKIQQQGQKQKINIYEQAQQAEGLNQFVTQPKITKNEPEKNSNNNSYNPNASKDLNLNDLLGVNKKPKGGDDLADLIGTSNNNKKAKKNGDFFGDLDL